jgi:integrase
MSNSQLSTKADQLHLLRLAGGIRLRDVNSDTIREIDEQLEESGASTALRDNVRFALNAALGLAFREGKIPRNPVQAVKPIRHIVKEKHPLTLEQAINFVAACQSERLGPMYLLCLTTGIRQAEAYGLKPSDFDLKRRVVLIERQLHERKGGGFTEVPHTKTYERRLVPITKSLVPMIQRHLELPGRKAPYIFTAQLGGPLRPTVENRKVWKPFVKRLGLPHDFGMHHLRHTCKTLLLQAGVDKRVRDAILGHNTGSVSDLYEHTNVGMLISAGDRLEELLSGPNSSI